MVRVIAGKVTVLDQAAPSVAAVEMDDFELRRREYSGSQHIPKMLTWHMFAVMALARSGLTSGLGMVGKTVYLSSACSIILAEVTIQLTPIYERSCPLREKQQASHQKSKQFQVKSTTQTLWIN